MSIKAFTYNIKSPIKIGIIAGQHGNEKGPSILTQTLINNNYFLHISKKYNFGLKIIPIVNEYGYIKNSRYYYTTDINRNYKNNNINNINNKIINFLKDCIVIIDLHEGWGYHKQNKNSLGSSINLNNLQNLYNYKINNIIKNIVYSINLNIANNNHKFSYNILDDKKYKDSLIYYCTNNNINCIVVEITGQNNIQPIYKRMNQTFYILHNFFKLLYTII